MIDNLSNYFGPLKNSCTVQLVWAKVPLNLKPVVKAHHASFISNPHWWHSEPKMWELYQCVNIYGLYICRPFTPAVNVCISRQPPQKLYSLSAVIMSLNTHKKKERKVGVEMGVSLKWLIISAVTHNTLASEAFSLFRTGNDRHLPFFDFSAAPPHYPTTPLAEHDNDTLLPHSNTQFFQSHMWQGTKK